MTARQGGRSLKVHRPLRLGAELSLGARWARLGLACAYALDAATDPAAHQKPLLWKDAPPDIPIYQQAEEEYYAKVR